jgi:DNA modification methylase
MDLFAGTCVTALAALRLNRRSVMVESDVDCMLAATTRLQHYYAWLKENNALLPVGTTSVRLL